MKKVMCAIIIVMLISCVALASQYGAYNGFDIVKVFIGGNEVVNDVPAVIMDGRTMVPIRVISEQLGMSVDWVDSFKSVFITDLNKPHIQMFVNYMYMLTMLERVSGELKNHAFMSTFAAISIGNNGGSRDILNDIQQRTEHLKSLSNLLDLYSYEHLSNLDSFKYPECEEIKQEYKYYVSLLKDSISNFQEAYDSLIKLNSDRTNEYQYNKYTDKHSEAGSKIDTFYSSYHSSIEKIYNNINNQMFGQP